MEKEKIIETPHNVVYKHVVNHMNNISELRQQLINETTVKFGGKAVMLTAPDLA
jgi:hypothetical protein